MRRIESQACVSIAAFALAMICLSFEEARAQFPPRGNDTTTSLGSFRIFIDPAYRPLVSGYPGYNASTFQLQSPTLYDPATEIGRSGPIVEPVPPPGALVGVLPSALVSDGDFSLVPPAFEAAAGTREVHTQIRSMNLGFLGAAVLAGEDAPFQPRSVGEVESKSGNSGNPALDFPARSFFDVFVEVQLPFLGAPMETATLINYDPLLVVEENLLGFPPRVVYKHGNSNAVPIYFAEDSQLSSSWQAGDLFGWLVLAGHGLTYTNTPLDVAEFEGIVAGLSEMPVPGSNHLPLAARKLILKQDTATGKAKLVLVVKPLLQLLPAQSPIDVGATLQVEGVDQTGSTPLPASGWSTNSSGSLYKFKAAPDSPRPCKALLKDGTLLKIVCKDSVIDLDDPLQGTVRVRLTIGSDAYCVECTSAFRDEPGTYMAKECGAPADCLP